MVDCCPVGGSCAGLQNGMVVSACTGTWAMATRELAGWLISVGWS